MREEQVPMWAADLMKGLAQVHGKVEELTDAIKGNGEPGLLHRVSKIEKWQTKVVAVGSAVASGLSFAITAAYHWFTSRHHQ